MSQDQDNPLREFDELARQEAEERGEVYVSPFDDAAELAAPDHVAPVVEQLQFGETPPKRDRKKKATGGKRGRPKKKDGDPAPKAKPAASAKIEGPPPPAMPAAAGAPQMPGPIPPEQLVPLLKRVDQHIAARARTEPLSEQELAEGAAILSPLLHHYMPALVTSDKPWVPLAVWAGAVYLPRVLDRAPVPAPARIADTEAHPASSTATTFPGARPVGAAPLDAATPTPVSTAPIFVNQMANQPVSGSPAA